MYKVTYRGLNVGSYNAKGLAVWKVKNLCLSAPQNWKKEHFKIEKL